MSSMENRNFMILRANAKINLALDVIGERPNGYHDVKMIMQSVNLYDELDIRENDCGNIILKSDNDEIVCDESNLIYRAAVLLQNSVNRHDGVTIKLTKNIPVAAGMAGGSTDAAATLVGLNKLFGYGLDNEQLRNIGVKLGADIPFCIEGGTYLSEGIGEILTPLANAPDCFLVIIKPDINVSTKYVYDNLILDNNTCHPNVDFMLSQIEANSLAGVASCLGNILETVTANKYSIIKDIKELLLEKGALNALMSGSGPTVFGIFEARGDAEEALNFLKSRINFKQGFVTTFAKEGICIIP